MITSALMPTIMASVTLLVCIVWWPDVRALCIGIPAGLFGWGIMALVAQHLATVERANPDVYQELHCRFVILQTQMCTIRNASPNPAQPPYEDPHLSRRLTTATAEINTYLCEVGKVLDHERATMKAQHNEGPRQDWVLGYGYITLLKQIHRVEENLLLIASRPAVQAEARYDKLRLQDSTIPSHNALLSYLNSAVAILNASQQCPPHHQPPLPLTYSLHPVRCEPTRCREPNARRVDTHG